jgi:hypothetical protein
MITAVAEMEREAQAAVAQVLELTFGQQSPCVVVTAPPGSGKTSLVAELVAVAVLGLHMRVAVLSARWEQIFNLIRRIAGGYQPMAMQLLAPESRLLPSDVLVLPGMLRPTSAATQLARGPSAIFASAAKFSLSVANFKTGEFDLLIIDEAFQLSARELDPVYHICRCMVQVGDPGQLRPLVLVDTAPYEDTAAKVHWPAPTELIRRRPDIPVVALPATRRLPMDTTRLVQPAFYPTLPFSSLASSEQQRLSFEGALGESRVDGVLSMISAAEPATLIGALLPGLSTQRSIDTEVTELAAELAARILQLQPTWVDQRSLTASDIGCLDSHVASGAEIRRQLRQRGLSTDLLMVETPEVYQGLERAVTIAVHPLTGTGRLSDFNVDAGRWCVMTTRHQLACIVVGREQILNSLREYRPRGHRSLAATDAEWQGLQAHLQLWEQLEAMGRLVRL